MKKFQRVYKQDLKKDETIDEAMVRDWIYENPDVLDLGTAFTSKAKERWLGPHSKVDLVLTSSDAHYVVEIQLGKLDGDHVTRVLEYWDLWRKHAISATCIAVLIAEDVTSRYLNVIRLFENIPIVVIQMEALRIKDSSDVYFNFVKVMDRVKRLEDDDDDDDDASESELRGDFEAMQTMPIANAFIGIAREIEPSFQPIVQKTWIKLECDGKSGSFLRLTPQKKKLQVYAKTPECQAIWKLKAAGVDAKEMTSQGWLGWFKVALTKEEFDGNRDPIKELIGEALKNA